MRGANQRNILELLRVFWDEHRAIIGKYIVSHLFLQHVRPIAEAQSNIRVVEVARFLPNCESSLEYGDRLFFLTLCAKYHCHGKCGDGT